MGRSGLTFERVSPQPDEVACRTGTFSYKVSALFGLLAALVQDLAIFAIECMTGVENGYARM
jgi:hypothetical protein